MMSLRVVDIDPEDQHNPTHSSLLQQEILPRQSNIQWMIFEFHGTRMERMEKQQTPWKWVTKQGNYKRFCNAKRNGSKKKADIC